MADINEQEHHFEHLGIPEIPLYHLAPFFLDLDRYLGITVTRQVHVVQCPVDVVKIDGLGLARLRGGPCICFAVHQRIDEG